MIVIQSDGATEGHNGKLGTVTHCGIGFYCINDGHRYSKRIEAISNNEAEFYALIAAMKYAIEKGYKRVCFQLDSQIVVNRANAHGIRQRDPNNPKHTRSIVMDGFQRTVEKLKLSFDICAFSWIPREYNSEADIQSKASLYPKP